MDEAALLLPDPTGLARNHAEARAEAARLAGIVEAHFDFVWRVLRRMGVPECDTDDAAQQCFMVAARRLGDIVGGQERAFLFQTAVRVTARFKRTRRRQREEGDEALAGLQDPSGGPDERLDQARARSLLDEVLDTMSEELRAAFVLFELEGFTAPELAVLQSIPVGTAASRIRRARAHFEERAQKLRSRLGQGALR